MKQLVEGFIQQLQDATQLAAHTPVAFSGLQRYNNVVLAGMGSSGLAADLIRSYVADKLTVPVLVHKSYDAPAFIGPDTLFIAISFSGNTEETLTAMRAALKKEAALACVTSGGEMRRMAQENELPHLFLPGKPEVARASLGYTLVAILYLLHYAGLLDDTFKTELAQSVTLLEEQQGSIKVQASVLASAFHSKLPVLYVSHTVAPVARRFQQQLNTNAKQLAHIGIVPEINHNELEARQFPDQLFSQLAMLQVFTAYDHPRVRRSMHLSKPLLKEKAGEVMTLEAVGATMLEQTFYLIHLFDWVSVYLAKLNQVDPTTIPTIHHLKEKLSRD
ncbi:bifunctional phosphoglucose/phosphomannose isomerase [Pontibacter liquoris]|uniref:bifunctional phosphoglucose/phosphomannose isomerase n=1 Tax=Pontibacter liquoris TaxID=2905677 RepID=UPI001FA80033|nr:bifunctional phosphoglucose/phosphomannose isomerase [Pontibacter liquoris]